MGGLKKMYEPADDKTFAMHFAAVTQQYRDGAIEAIEAIANMTELLAADDMHWKLETDKKKRGF